MEINIWLIVGLGLVLWAFYDLFNGKVLLHREISREYEPIFYWIVWVIWMGIGVVVTLGSL